MLTNCNQLQFYAHQGLLKRLSEGGEVSALFLMLYDTRFVNMGSHQIVFQMREYPFWDPLEPLLGSYGNYYEKA